MTWVYFVKEKSQVFGIFKKFTNFVEKQTGSFIKILRSDQGKEYNSKEFDKFCEDEGMRRQVTTRYTPQQNGVVETKNKTVVEMGKSMAHEKSLPKNIWAEAVYTAIYLLNRSPTKALDNKTPLEACVNTNNVKNVIYIIRSLHVLIITKYKNMIRKLTVNKFLFEKTRLLNVSTTTSL